MKFEGGDGESDCSYKVCWSDCEKRILDCHSVLADILVCDSAVGENVVYLKYEGFAGT